MGIFENITPFLELTIIAIMMNYILSFFWNTRSMDLMLGLLAFLIIYALSSLFNFPILKQIMLLFANVAVIAILIIFQPELRVALSKLSFKGKRLREITEFDKFLELLTSSVYRLADKKIGALVALEHEHSLEDYAKKGVMIGAHFSSELLETIFASTTPLHDGAVIIRDLTILSANVIIPLSEDTLQLAKSIGTRHRAALALSQLTDALVIVVSEESGHVSIARDGVITRGIKVDRFQGIIRSVFAPIADRSPPYRFKLLNWLKE
jgi:diadenylate cyclase